MANPNQGNRTFETIIDPNEGQILIPMEFYLQWQTQLHRQTNGKLRTYFASTNVMLCLDDDQPYMFYGQRVAKTFGIEKATRVLLEYMIDNNEFQLTLIPDVDDVSPRQKTFETVVHPTEAKIIIPNQFYEQWKLELHSKVNGRINTPDASQRVSIVQENGQCFMLYGYTVARTFGLQKPTRVVLEYQIHNNNFALTIMPEVETMEGIGIEAHSVESKDHTDIIYISSTENDSDMNTPELDEDGGDEPVTDEAPMEIESWCQNVTKAMDNTKKKQVLHFPAHISKGMLANATEVELTSEDSNLRYRCPVGRNAKMVDQGWTAKHLGRGWYEYVDAHRPTARDNLLFVLTSQPLELNVKLIRIPNYR